MQALQERIRVLAGREERARRALDAVSDERAKLEAERAALLIAEQIYRRTLGIEPEDAPTTAVQTEIRIRARVGPQRYLMLSTLRNSHRPMSFSDIADSTKLGVKRIKDQLVADEQLGVVKSDWDAYSITDTGLGLLSRFEAYKQIKGEDLPTVGNVPYDQDSEEPE